MDQAERCFFFEGEYGIFRELSAGVSAGFTTGTKRGRRPAARLAHDLAAALGAASSRIALTRQVHGRDVLVVDAAANPSRSGIVGTGDALITREAGILLGIQSADCVPILLADAAGPWIAAVHAGWRGTAARILDALLGRLELEGVPPSHLAVAFGPRISRDRYEVGPEVVTELSRAYGDLAVPFCALRPGREDRAWLDIAAFNRALLVRRGVPPERILDAALCTASRADLFPSYRRDGKGAGRIVTGIVRRRAP
ncbi:MAG: polyphenol oxidase family protein [Acidithiobacillales bacterium]